MPLGRDKEMREIKFRAWDKVCREMFYNSELANGDMMVICLDGEIQLSDDDTYKPDDFILMQYTGLKDKNGKEIYEGDILRLWRSTGKNGEPRGEYYKPFPVEYCELWTQFVVVDKANKAQMGIWQAFGAFEVIGNIYENPELLGGE